MTIAMITLSTPRPIIASSTSATRIEGKPRTKSTIRISRASVLPPITAATRPTQTPMIMASAVETSPTSRLTRIP